ncbi:AIR synthase-related protein [Sphingobacterium hungaricum]
MEQQLGKIDQHLVDEFIQQKCGHSRQEVRVGSQFGVDVSLIDLPNGLCIAMSSDPLSLIPSLGLEESAWLSVQLLANDMATTGYAPQYAQFVLNLPAHFPKKDFQTYWDYIHRYCEAIGIAITGGHTGFIEGQNSTIAGGGTFISIAPKDKLLVSKYAQAGDSILVTKSCAISSAAILAMSYPETVKNKAGQQHYQDACQSFYQTSSLLDALTAVGYLHEHTDVTAMHDVTEGGVLGAIYELATASGNGATIHSEKLPIAAVQASVCDVFSLDPRHCVGAGSMIITCNAGSAPAVIERLAQKNIACTDVGQLTAKEQGIQLIEVGKTKWLNYQAEDPYWVAFFKAYHLGWK